MPSTSDIDLDPLDRHVVSRMRRAMTALDRALTDLQRVARRVETHRRRVARCEALLRIPAQERRARAMRAAATRRERMVPPHRRRGIRVTDEGGG